jgi:hypothetical protein
VTANTKPIVKKYHSVSNKKNNATAQAIVVKRNNAIFRYKLAELAFNVFLIQFSYFGRDSLNTTTEQN